MVENINGKHESENVLNDKEIYTIGESKLYDEAYPKALAEFIKNCDTPLTIAIQGEWGSGKTSMANLVKKELENSNVLCTEGGFNAWMYSQFNLGEQLPLTFLKHLGKMVNYDKGLSEIIKKVGLDIIRFAGKKFGGSDDLLNWSISDDIDKLNNIKNGFEKAIKNQLNDIGKEKLLIFIDDIDRLEPEKAVELLECIKLFCDCENCIFLLAVDYDVILEGARKKFGNDKGKAFFDKIIQVPFKMPVSKYNIDAYIKTLLDELCGDIKNEKIKEEIYKHYIDISKITINKNPRSIKRLLNTFKIADMVAENLGIYDVGDSNINGYKRLLLYCLFCIEENNEEVQLYLLNKTEEYEEGNNIDDFFKSINDIVNDEDEIIKNEFLDVIEDKEYDINIISKFLEVLKILINIKVKNEVIFKIIKLSEMSTRSNKERGKNNKEIPSELKDFNEKCNASLIEIRNKLNENQNKIIYKMEKGSNLQHRPRIFYIDKKSNVKVIFECIYDENNTNDVKIKIQYYGDKLDKLNNELFNKIVNLKAFNEQKNTTTGISYNTGFKFPIDNFNKLIDFIKEYEDKLNSVFT